MAGNRVTPGGLRLPLIYDHIPVRGHARESGCSEDQGDPAAPRAVGRGDARERALFSHWGPRHAAWWGEPEQRSERVLTRMAGTRERRPCDGRGKRSRADFAATR